MNKENLELFIIKHAESLANALQKIECNKSQTLIVVDESGFVVGTLTDGDVRKALLAKRTLLAPVYDVMNTNYIALSLEQKADAHKIFSAHYYINLIPVVNEDGSLQDIIAREASH